MLGVGQAQEIQGQPSDPWVRVGVGRAKIVRRVTCRRNHRQHSGAVGRTQGLGARERTGGAHRWPVGAGRTWQGRRTRAHTSTHLARDWSQKQRKQDVLSAATRFQRVPALLRAPQVLLRDGQAQLSQQRVLVGLAVVVDRDLEIKYEKRAKKNPKQTETLTRRASASCSVMRWYSNTSLNVGLSVPCLVEVRRFVVS